MDMKVIKSEGSTVFLRVQGVSPAYMNTLRRLMMTEVPVLAVENVEVRKNSGALYDEILAHRLGMLSIKTDPKSYDMLPKDAKFAASESAKHHVKLTLQVTGPKTVYAEDITSNDPKIKPVHGKTPITKLMEGQEIELEAIAIMGQGTTHAKWNAALVYYKEFPHITVNSQPENADELVSEYPEILEMKNKKLSIKEDALPFYDVHEEVIAKSNGALSVDYKDDYVLTIESWEQLTPKEIIEGALSLMDESLDEVKSLVKTA